MPESAKMRGKERERERERSISRSIRSIQSYRPATIQDRRGRQVAFVLSDARRFPPSLDSEIVVEASRRGVPGSGARGGKTTVSSDVAATTTFDDEEEGCCRSPVARIPSRPRSVSRARLAWIIRGDAERRTQRTVQK